MLTTQTTIIEIVSSKATDYIAEIVSSYLDNYLKNPDYLELREEDKLSIGIKQTRGIISWAKLRPFQSVCKIAVIFNAEKLTIEAQNSLLKLLEEPPSNTYILLVTNNHKALLQTIISRATLNRVEGSELVPQSANEAKEVLISDISQKVKWVDELMKIKNSKERREQIQAFLGIAHRTILECVDSDQTAQNLKLLEKTTQALRRNVNNKLLLENFLFNYIPPN